MSSFNIDPLGELLLFRHPIERMSSFAIRLQIGGVTDRLMLSAPNGRSDIRIEVLQRADGDMVPACVVAGHWDQPTLSYELVVSDPEGRVLFRMRTQK